MRGSAGAECFTFIFVKKGRAQSSENPRAPAPVFAVSQKNVGTRTVWSAIMNKVAGDLRGSSGPCHHPRPKLTS